MQSGDVYSRLVGNRVYCTKGTEGDDTKTETTKKRYQRGMLIKDFHAI